jgi:hypothetical protein
MTNCVDIIHRLSLSSYLPRVYVVLLFFILRDLWPVTRDLNCPETGTSSIYWAQQSRCPFLPDDGDTLQSPKRRVSFYQG